MAISGIFLILFLLMHMFGNTKIMLTDGIEHFNHYSHWLRVLGEPILPHSGFLWLFRIFMLACIAVHIYCAIYVWKHSADARGKGKSQFLHGAYVPFLMRWGGVLIILFLVAHILQFTTQTIHLGYEGSIDPAHRLIFAMQNPLCYLAYLLCMAAVCFHVAHGFWALFATLGANTSLRSEKILRALAIIVAVVLFLGFMAAPTTILLGVVK